MAEFIVPTQVAFDAITKRTTQRRERQFLAVAARFDRRLQRVMITLTNGAVVGFPPLGPPRSGTRYPGGFAQNPG